MVDRRRFLAGGASLAGITALDRLLAAQRLPSGPLPQQSLLQSDPEGYFHGGSSSGPSGEQIGAQIEARLAARKRKDFAEADRIRKELEAAGIILEDRPKGTTWRRK